MIASAPPAWLIVLWVGFGSSSAAHTMASDGPAAKKSRKQLSPEFVEEEGEDIGGAGDSTGLSQPSGESEPGPAPGESAQGEPFFELSSKRRIAVRRWKKSILVDIREYWDDGGQLRPGKKEISLSLDQWQQLMKLAPSIDRAIQAIQ